MVTIATITLPPGIWLVYGSTYVDYSDISYTLGFDWINQSIITSFKNCSISGFIKVSNQMNVKLQITPWGAYSGNKASGGSISAVRIK